MNYEKKVIYFKKSSNGDITPIYSKNEISASDKIVQKYKCKNGNCSVVPISTSSNEKSIYNYVVIRDNNKFILFDYKQNKIYETGLKYTSDYKLDFSYPGVYGIFVGYKKYYSIKYDKIIKIKSGNFNLNSFQGENLNIYNYNDNEKSSILDVNTEKITPIYLYYSSDRKLAVFKVDDIPTYDKNYEVEYHLSIEITIYEDGYMQVYNECNGAVIENSRGKYTVKDGILTYKRIYNGSYDSINWSEYEYNETYKLPLETTFNINDDNTLTSTNFNFFDDNAVSATLKRTYATSSFKF